MSRGLLLPPLCLVLGRVENSLTNIDEGGIEAPLRRAIGGR